MSGKKITGYVIFNKSGDLISGSNGSTSSEARNRHVCDMGYMKWREAYSAGYRVVKVIIKPA